jgi:ubiquinone/menaquinone biosynthesis C-methylase UbiE
MSKHEGSRESEKASTHTNAMQHMAHNYDMMVMMMMMGHQKAVRNTCINLAGIQPGDHVLEIGCGTGSLTMLAKRKAGESGVVVGIDPLQEMREIATRKARKAKLEITFQAGELEHIPYPDGSFDVVLASFMIFHTDDATRQEGLNEVCRVIKPGGRFLIVDPQAPGQQKVSHVEKMLMRHLKGAGMFDKPLASLEPMLKAARFKSVKTGGTKYAVLGYVLSTK